MRSSCLWEHLEEEDKLFQLLTGSLKDAQLDSIVLRTKDHLAITCRSGHKAATQNLEKKEREIKETTMIDGGGKEEKIWQGEEWSHNYTLWSDPGHHFHPTLSYLDLTS